jgi:Ca2+-binding EF-hand superfamily protein
VESETDSLVSEEACEVAIMLLSSSGSRDLDEKDFKQWWAQEEKFELATWNARELERLQLFRDLFRLYDRDGSGTISAEELVRLHTELSEDGVHLGTLAECLSGMDKDGNKLISFQEFVDYLKKCGAFAD